jgi:hypothetical protein
MGIEPTEPGFRRIPAGFEVQASHQAGFTSMCSEFYQKQPRSAPDLTAVSLCLSDAESACTNDHGLDFFTFLKHPLQGELNLAGRRSGVRNAACGSHPGEAAGK